MVQEHIIIGKVKPKTVKSVSKAYIYHTDPFSAHLAGMERVIEILEQQSNGGVNDASYSIIFGERFHPIDLMGEGKSWAFDTVSRIRGKWEHPLTYAYLEHINKTLLDGKLIYLASDDDDGFEDLSIQQSKKAVPSAMAR